LPSDDSAFWAWSTAGAFAALATSSDGLTRVEAAPLCLVSASIGAVAPHHRRIGLVLLLRQFANPITLIQVFATVPAPCSTLKRCTVSVLLALVDHYRCVRAGNGGGEVFYGGRDIAPRAVNAGTAYARAPR